MEDDGDTDEEHEEAIKHALDEVTYADITWSEAKKYAERYPNNAVWAERAERANRDLVLKSKNLNLVMKATKGMTFREYVEEGAESVELEKQQKKLKSRRPTHTPREEGGPEDPPTQGPFLSIGKIQVDPKVILGKGASGIVYRGRFDGRDVAVKRVMAGINVDREAELHIKCDDASHPNVCRYLYKENDPMGDTYLVLELCLGTLTDYVEGKLAIAVERQAKDLLNDATKGIHHLHKLGIVHRDIKPSNILISRSQNDPTTARALIGDFGFSKELNKGQQSFSISEGWRGTLRWMAPEVLTGREGGTLRATMAVDVYALGCVFYYTLTNGEPLFHGEDDVEVMSNIKDGFSDLSGLVHGFLYTNYAEEVSEEVRTYILADYSHEVNAVPFVHSSSHRRVTDLFTSQALIACMISHDAEQRPPMEAVLKHPYFWSEEEKLEYIKLVSDHLRKSSPTSDFYQDFEYCKSDILGSVSANWYDLIRHFHPDLDPIINYAKKPPPEETRRAWYNFESVASLLRVIRNLSNHLTTLPREVQFALQGSSPKTLLSELFTGIFPRLLVFTWLVMSDEAAQQPGLKDYYHHWWRGRAAYIYQSLTDGRGMWPQYKPITSVQPFRCAEEEPDDWSQPQVSKLLLSKMFFTY